MQNITIVEPGRASVSANRMRVGQLGVTDVGDVVLRIYDDRWVSLRNPSETWTDTFNIEVQIVPPGSTVSFITT